jgi:alginate O-acetyltransferase complex protein AlgI
MLFNSREFLVFFPAVASIFFLLPVRFRWLWLLLASYVFYMWKRPEDGLLIALITASSFIGSLLVSSARTEKARRRFLLSDIGFCLSLLAYYKYADFFIANLNGVLSHFGSIMNIPLPQNTLPIGLSFYTFMAISYSVDVYRRQETAERHVGIYALFLSFFPHLVAGPIMRSHELRPQFRQVQTFTSNAAAEGLRLILWGLFKKMVIADSLAGPVTAIYADPTPHTGLTLLLATVFFAVQIYCDFSGYCDIAMGAAKFLGFRLPVNFDRPYGSRSVSEFWRRWHITLGTWFRDYVYIPLGGRSDSRASHYANLMIVFLLSGLWHGANWTFILWGVLHGAFIIVERSTYELRSRIVATLNLSTEIHDHLGRVWTLSCVIFAWIFFRAQTLDHAIHVTSHIPDGLVTQITSVMGWTQAAQNMSLSHGELAWLLALTIGVVAAHWSGRPGSEPRALDFSSRAVRHTSYCVLISLILFAGHTQEVQFIYFQF